MSFAQHGSPLLVSIHLIYDITEPLGKCITVALTVTTFLSWRITIIYIYQLFKTIFIAKESHSRLCPALFENFFAWWNVYLYQCGRGKGLGAFEFSELY